jgi:hypothetical protein
MTDLERAEYVNAAWEAYLERHGHERLISPIEFALIRSWLESDYPLRVVLGAIRDTAKIGRSLLYMELPVEEAMARVRSGM